MTTAHRRRNAGRSTSPPPCLAEALDWLDRGVSAFALPPNGKKANDGWKRWQTERPTQYDLGAMFKKTPSGNLAVMVGPVSGGLAVRDFDTAAAYKAWKVAHPDWAASLPTVRTRRGFHVYFRAGDEVRARYASGSPKIGEGEGELRLDRCYVVAPPSVVGGFVYQWIVPWRDWPPILDPAEAGLDRPFLAQAAERDSAQSNRATEQRIAIRRGESGPVPAPAKKGQKREGENTKLEKTQISRIELDKLPPRVRLLVCTAIESTLPDRPGVRNGKLFEFCRFLKAADALCDLPAGAFLTIVREWHRKALPHIATKPFADTWTDFVNAWAAVKIPVGRNLAESLRRALDEPPPQCAEPYLDNPRLVALIQLCRELGGETGEFFLACRLAGEVLETPFRTVNDWLRGLERAGILQVIERGTPGGSKATRFRYLGD